MLSCSLKKKKTYFLDNLIKLLSSLIPVAYGLPIVKKKGVKKITLPLFLIFTAKFIEKEETETKQDFMPFKATVISSILKHSVKTR